MRKTDLEIIISNYNSIKKTNCKKEWKYDISTQIDIHDIPNMDYIILFRTQALKFMSHMGDRDRQLPGVRNNHTRAQYQLTRACVCPWEMPFSWEPNISKTCFARNPAMAQSKRIPEIKTVAGTRASGITSNLLWPLLIYMPAALRTRRFCKHSDPGEARFTPCLTITLWSLFTPEMRKAI